MDNTAARGCDDRTLLRAFFNTSRTPKIKNGGSFGVHLKMSQVCIHGNLKSGLDCIFGA